MEEGKKLDPNTYIRINNILGHDFEFTVGQNGEIVRILVPADNEKNITINGNDMGGRSLPAPLANLCCIHMVDRMIDENDQTEMELDQGRLVKVRGGVQHLDLDLRQRYIKAITGDTFTNATTGKQSFADKLMGNITKDTEAAKEEAPVVLNSTSDRKSLLEAMDYKSELQPLAMALELPGNLNKENMITAILAKEGVE